MRWRQSSGLERPDVLCGLYFHFIRSPINPFKKANYLYNRNHLSKWFFVYFQTAWMFQWHFGREKNPYISLRIFCLVEFPHRRWKFCHRNPSHHQRFKNWLVVSTHLKNISQNGNLPQIGMKIKNVWNHHLENAGGLSASSFCWDILFFSFWAFRFLLSGGTSGWTVNKARTVMNRLDSTKRRFNKNYPVILRILGFFSSSFSRKIIPGDHSRSPNITGFCQKPALLPQWQTCEN